MPDIVIVAYRPEWEEEFAAIAAGLRDSLGQRALRVDHIGSTAVPGLAAKNTIDVQITVRDLTSELEPLLLRAGYQRNTEIAGDHIPPHTAGSARDWEKQFYHSTPGARRVNIHVRRAGSANGRYALLFRDYLRAHPLAATGYARAKMALARYAPGNWDFYYDVKDPICDIIMAGAEDWAAATHWHIEHYA